MMRDPMNTRVCLVVCCLTIALWLVSFASAGFHCVEASQVHSSYKCYRSVKLLSNSSSCQHSYSCDPQNDVVTWTSLNPSSGLFEASFLLAPSACNYTKYTLLLMVPANDVSSQQECEVISKFELIHTKREYLVEDFASCLTNNCSVCGKTGSVRFQFVFPGCYQLEIKPTSGQISHRTIRSCPIFLESNYKKALISAENPSFEIVQENIDQNSPVLLSFSFVPLTCSRLELEIKLMQNIRRKDKHECYKSGNVHSKFTIGNEEKNCDEHEEQGTQNATCKIDADKVSCIFKEIRHGNYCAIMEILDDDRCQPNTLWTAGDDNRCRWHEAFYRPAASAGLEPIEDAGHTYALFGGIVVVSLIVAVLGVWLKFKHLKAPRMDPGDGTGGALAGSGVNEGALNSRARCGVLLLYARDCEPFMHLMQSFRRYLEDAVKLEVYDCFDANRWEQVSCSPTEWMRRLALHPEVKVIAVASSCASLRLEAHLTNARLHYAQPTCMDDLFVFALQLLGDNVHRDNGYQKMFVVRFDGFSEDLDLFTHLNSYTRYVLPAHFDLLVNNLNPSAPDQSLQLMNQDQLHTIRQDLKKLVRYKNENGNYLEDYLLIRKFS